MDNLQLLVNLFSHAHENPLFAYAAVFSVLLICGFGVPIPEDISLVAGGIIAGLGYADVNTMFFVGLAGVLVGDSMMFVAGRVYGERVRCFPLVAKFLTEARYAAVQDQFHKYGKRVLFVARFLPGLRTPIFLTAGMTRRVPFWRFLLLDGSAALISVPVWVYLGYYGAHKREWLMSWVHVGQKGILIVLAIVITATAIIYFRRKKKNSQSSH
ncbi:DedA family protein [Leeia sp. TBRC 13508]|uniref:DedA family protein n=1 Tax=Leeia speluncae TaxID=2884804 RepID=A0ABS8D6D6_9NEIS|nr:DedA family protein [Leeia speluncae]MCB6183583.1 DedA family protein [Leeia speluncae]